MKKVYASLCMALALAATGQAMAAAAKEEKTENAEKAKLVINGYGNTGQIVVNSRNLSNGSVSVSATAGFEVSPSIIKAGEKNKIEIKLVSSKSRTRGNVILRCGDVRYTLPIEGIAESLPVKDLSQSPVYNGGKNEKWEQADFKPEAGKGYTIEFKVSTNEDGTEFCPYAVDANGNGFKAYIASTELGLYHAQDKAGGIPNPATAKQEGGKGIFYNNDEQAHTYRFAVTPDNRAFIFRDGMPIDTVRLADYGRQSDWATGNGDIKENLLINSNFEGEYENFDQKDLTTVARGIEGWRISILDFWCTQSFIAKEEIDNAQDFNNHIFRTIPYKWNGNWGGADINQIVDVAPNETYTLTTLAKGGIRQKEGTMVGSLVIEEMQNRDKKAVIQIASDSWETYSTDFTTSPDCKQVRISFRNEAGKYGENRSPLEFDNVKFMGKSRKYTPKIGFENNQADVVYFTYDTTGAYAPARPEITIDF